MGEPDERHSDDEESLDIPMDPAITRKSFRQWRAPRHGTSNPDRMNNPVWEWLVRSRATAYSIAQHFNEPSAMDVGQPGWCFFRFGRTETILPDGRRVLIGGEHEDCYDPDFYIYNDVVVLHPPGNMDIWGYPAEVFPPTDFHSATLAGEKVYIIGGLSYPEARKKATTPVFCLDLNTFAISAVPTLGKPPGWIYRHTAEISATADAVLLRGGRIDEVRNINTWQLRLDTGRWEQLTALPWQVWQVARADGQLVHLWQIRAQLTNESLGLPAVSEPLRQIQDQFGIPSLEEQVGGVIDREALERLYAPSVEHEQLPNRGKYDTHRIQIEGVTINYQEDLHGVEVTFEGALSQKVINTVVRDLESKLSRVEGAPCKARRSRISG